MKISNSVKCGDQMLYFQTRVLFMTFGAFWGGDALKLIL